MELKKSIKKIIAIGAGFALVGATVLGAVSNDLSNYPKPFINNGMFNGVIVVGDNAASSDVIGSVDIATSMQYLSRKAIMSDKLVASDGVLITSAGNDFNYGDKISDVDKKLTDEDLPRILFDGKYKESKGTRNDVTYSQTITLGDSPKLVFEPDKNSDNEATDSYLKLFKNSKVFTYELKFDNPVEYDEDDVSNDFKNSKLDILGTTYTFNNVDDDMGDVTKLTLNGGSVTSTLNEGEIQTYTIDGEEYTVEAKYIGTSTVRFVVNNVMTDTLSDGDSEIVSGIDLGVNAIMAQNLVGLPDQVEFYLGSHELVLEDGKEAKLNDKVIDGSLVEINSDSGELYSIKLSYSMDDNEYIGLGESWSDPIFELFKLSLVDIVQDIETITFSSEDDSSKIEYTNNEGDAVSIPVIDDDSVIAFGNDANYLSMCEDDSGLPCAMMFEDSTCTSLDVEDCKGISFLAVSDGGESRVYKLSNIDSDGLKYDIKDMTTGMASDNLNFNEEVTVGPMNIRFDLDNDTIIATELGDVSKIYTDKGNKIELSTSSDKVSVSISSDETGIELFDVSLDLDSDHDERIKISGAVMYDLNDNSNTKTGIDELNYGARVVYDNENKDNLVVYMPDEQVYSEVYVMPIDAEVSSVANSSYEITPIPVGMSKLASEVSNINSVNAIVIGGPCANAAAATLMDNPEPCYQGFTEGKAMIKLYESGNYVAMLVAGATALDTRRACRVLANYEDYSAKFIGNEIEVSGTTLSDISISSLS